jgi:5'-3' exonuclease
VTVAAVETGHAGVPLLLAVDGNSLLHRAYHAGLDQAVTDDAGRPVWAVKGMVSFVARAAARLRPDAVLIGFDCSRQSHRKADFPGYKAHRPPKPGDLVEQLELAPELLAAAGFTVVVPPGCEADDVLASGAARARDAGWRSVVVTSDRDAFQLVDATTSVLRVMNGGMDASPILTADTVRDVCGVTADRYRDFAALRGDPSDNLPGVHGVGGTIAARLLAAFGTAAAVYEALDGGSEAAVRKAGGRRVPAQLRDAAARENVLRNQRLMTMRTDVPIPDLDAMRVPLDRDVIRAALSARGIHLGPSLWALTGGTRPPDPDAMAALSMFAPLRRTRRAARVPGEGQLALF